MDQGNYSRGGVELAKAVQELYLSGQTDYSIDPIVLCDRSGEPVGRIKDSDAVVFCLRRGEREIQLTEAFVDREVGGFPRADFQNLPFIILTLYHEKFKDLPVAFAPTRISHTLGQTISEAGFRQLHISESEKFAHVTFFLNGGNNQAFAGEVDIKIPSPRGIPFEQVPQLNLAQVVEQVESGIQQGFELIVTNFANGDVIGHTQNREAKIRCAEFIDQYLGKVVELAKAAGYSVLVTADHGNLEEMENPDGSPNVSHTANPVPLLLITPQLDMEITLTPGILADITPTILALMGIPQPAEMTGRSLLHQAHGLKPGKVLLVILDGWGIGINDAANPIFLACTPNWDGLTANYACTQLRAAGAAVGLKPGKSGNSEAGHMNIGAGRIILQDDVKLEASLQDGSFFTNDIFLKTIEGVIQRHASLHLIGLLSVKSSHGSMDYPLALLKLAYMRGLQDVYLHLIFDGRSTEPGTAPMLLKQFEEKMNEIGIGRVVTGMGRGIALDRDGNYHKTQRAYEALVYGIGMRCRADWA